MQKTFPNGRHGFGHLPDFPKMTRVQQETLSYCGPAVIQMLLSYYDVDRTQQEIVDAVNVRHKIDTHGMTIVELARAVQILEPQMQFWFKHYSTISDLSKLINIFEQPVAVEWQGVFRYATKEDEENDDPGHYSIVTHLDTNQNVVLLSDPFRDFAGTDRHFSVLEFERRWWEINEVLNPETKRFEDIHEYHSMFLVTPIWITFPERVGMLRG